MTWEIRVGDALERLREMPAGSVQTCITSPPYFNLRDYGTGEWEGGDGCPTCGGTGTDQTDWERLPDCGDCGGTGECDHKQERPVHEDTTSTLGVPANGGPRRIGEDNATVVSKGVYRETCGKCGARRVDQQLGLEQTPDEYVARLVEVFREVRRVLRDDGTLWLNLGDSYSGGGGFSPDAPSNQAGAKQTTQGSREYKGRQPTPGLKQKDLLGIPWMVAFALRADGWYLRSDIIWSKPNPMPESVMDRPTKSHEFLFLLAKSPRYFYDADAIREAHESDFHREPGPERDNGVGDAYHGNPPRLQRTKERTGHASGRNKRSVWTVATQPFPGAHFAVFPPKLIEPCVLAGSAPKACGVCGAPWERVTESEQAALRDLHLRRERQRNIGGRTDGYTQLPAGGVVGGERRTTGWKASCYHADQPAPDDTGTSTVLDPFAGAGTTGLVAVRHGRSFIGIELNPGYAEMARDRIATAERLGFRTPEAGPAPIPGQVSMFEEAG